MGASVSHRLPGRIRIGIDDMRNQELLAYRLQCKLSQMRGITEVRCNSDTGRALVRFEPSCVSEDDVIREIETFLEGRNMASSVHEAVAATIESELPRSAVQQEQPNTGFSANPYLLPAIASSSLLGVLTLKRLILGRSGFASSPLTFWAAAGVSVAAGFPALRRGVERLVKERKATPDLWLGLATLSMAAVRENLVALSVITALNVAMHRRYAVVSGAEDTQLDPALEQHSEAMSRITSWLAPLALVFTRSPLRAMGVALAANPRPAIVSHKYRWARAEREAREQDIWADPQSGISSLKCAKEIVFNDESILYGTGNEWLIQPLRDGVDTGKVIANVASLLQKCDEHPWRQAFLERAKQDDRTLHAPFEVETAPSGVRGVIHSQAILLGNRVFLTRAGIDDTDFQLEERRMRRQGFDTNVLVVDGQALAVIGCKRSISAQWAKTLDEWMQQGYRVRVLRADRLQATRLEPVSPEQLQKQLDDSVRTIFVGRDPFVQNHASLVYVQEAELPRLPKALEYCRDVNRYSRRDIQVVKLWNWIGTAVGLAVPELAPAIALTGDVVSMFLISIQHWFERRPRNLAGVFRDSVGAAKPNRGSVDQKEPMAPPIHDRGQFSDFHAIGIEALLKRMGVSSTGLTTEQVKERRKIWGNNLLMAPSAPNPIYMFLRQFKELSTLILLGTAGVSFVMGERFSAVCMLGILVANALIGTWQEKRSSEVIQALKVDDDSQARVLRDDREDAVPTKDLVPGDMVMLEAGDKVPADIRILDSWNLEVNEAMLTGESGPVTKSVTHLPTATPLADRTNILFMGTMVTRGRCKGVVVATGSHTEIGRLGALINDQEEPPTFLQTRVSAISKRFVLGAFIAAGVVAAAGLLRGIPPAQLLISSVTLAASAIPEGLPLTITVALTAGVLHMSKRKTVIKKLANLESLGRVTVICSDKTGTLTKNEMTVRELVTADVHFRVSGEGYNPTGTFSRIEEPGAPVSVHHDADLRQLLTIGLLCNNAQLNGAQGAPAGDPTEAALLTVAQKAAITHHSWKRCREIPFDSETRSMSVVCQQDEQATLVCDEDVADKPPVSPCTLFAKGAPEVLLGKCTHYLTNGSVFEMTAEKKDSIKNANHALTRQALRVIAFAYKNVGDHEDPMDVTDDGLVYVGLMGMMDPPKEGVSESISEARKLGIKPVMITGDHPSTAQAIAAQVGIFADGDTVLTGQDLDRLSQGDLDRVIRSTSVFARVSPEHKLRIVEAYQRIGEVVAMTGDGVNDAPAIRKADVGIAMGQNGTDITKGTAGIVLMEDHFHSIVEGVKGGRAIIGNIRKAMGCLLSGNLAEVLVTAVSVIIGLPMPLIPLQILLMNILTDAVPAMVLATGQHSEVRKEPYKDVIDKKLYGTVVTRGAVLGLGAVAVFATALATGMALPLAQTMAYASLVVGQLLQTVAWRRYDSAQKVSFRRDRVLFGATVGSYLALAATIYIPGLQTVFGTVPLGIGHWGIVLAVTYGLTWVARQCIERFVNPQRTRPSFPIAATQLAM